MMDVGIIAIRYHLPSHIETNDDLRRENPDWRMAEIYAKSGISARHIAADEETASDLAYQAAVELFRSSPVAPGEIDYLIYCSQSPDYFLPSSACVLQHKLGLCKHVGAFDYNLGCSGFVYGLQIAKALVQGNFARYVLLITADTYSKFIHPRDRTVRTLFGDGAAATLIGMTSGPARIGNFVVGTDGAGADKLIVPGGAMRTHRSNEVLQETTDNWGCTRSQANLFMDGPAMFAFAISTVPKMLDVLLEKSKISSDNINWFIYHQANKYMLEQLARRSKIPANKMIIDVEDIGNTVSASIPIAIQRAVECGRILSGHQLLMAGFGVGYSWGLCDMVWG
jgi:3-oxoacyl-[acyl-carrier-protein] synthase III